MIYQSLVFQKVTNLSEIGIPTMATAKEMNVSRGDVVVAATAFTLSAPERRFQMGIITGSSLDKQGAYVTINVYRIKEVKPKETRVELLWTNFPSGVLPTEKPKVGEVKDIHAGFRNFLSPEDTELTEELARANIGIDIKIAPDRKSVELKRGEWTEVIPYK